MKCGVIIPAGGSGRRFGAKKPKQFNDFAGIPLLIRTILPFEEHESVESIIIPINSDWYNYTKEIVLRYNLKKVKGIVVGGTTRQESVNHGLRSEHLKDCDVVVIHDAVRPFVTKELIDRVLDAAEDYGAAIPALPPVDTIKEMNGTGIVTKTHDRNKLCSVQTPQAFWYDIIKEAFDQAAKAGFEGTDDAQLVEFIGYKVKVVEGETSNFKITTQNDLRVAEMFFGERNDVDEN